ncbi:leucine-rich repeat, cysteine-containing subtype protein, partial [Tanacetum coccineum]
MKLIADSCPNIKRLDLSVEQNLNSEVGSRMLVFIWFMWIYLGDKSLKIIAEATCLNVLHLQGCYLISDLGLEYLANGDLKHCLDTLYLGKCDRITDNGIIHLKKLVTLSSLSFNRCGGKITDYGIVALCELPNIKSLNLDHLFNITDISLLEIGRKCLNIMLICLQGCKRITGVGLRAFCGHQHLLVLNLISCYNISWEDVQSVVLTLPKLLIIRLSRSMKKPLPEAGLYDVFAKLKWYEIEASSPLIWFQFGEEDGTYEAVTWLHVNTLIIAMRGGCNAVQIVQTHHFASHLKRMAVVVRTEEQFYAFVKGAPEIIQERLNDNIPA